MKLANEAYREYEGITNNRMKDEQLEVAVRALHIIAIIPTSTSDVMNNIALDALREMETFGYLYDQFNEDYE